MRYESAKTAQGNVGVSYETQDLADEQARQMDEMGNKNCSNCSRCSDEKEINQASVAHIANRDEALAALDKVREIIIDDDARLEMGHWHETDEWRERNCAEEVVCGTTHCLAGWLQVCSADPAVRVMEPQMAGFHVAPESCGMFYQSSERVMEWLKNREYAKE